MTKPALKRVIIDQNIRLSFGDKNDATYSGYEDVIGEELPRPKEHVYVVEIESGLTGHARVLGMDTEKRLLFLDVDWNTLSKSSTPRSTAELLRPF